jgi:hypothetical protein
MGKLAAFEDGFDRLNKTMRKISRPNQNFTFTFATEKQESMSHVFNLMKAAI